MSNCLLCHGLYSPWNSLGHITGVGSCYLSRDPSQPRDWTQVSWIAGGFFTVWATKETQSIIRRVQIQKRLSGQVITLSLQIFSSRRDTIFLSYYWNIFLPIFKSLSIWLSILEEFRILIFPDSGDLERISAMEMNHQRKHHLDSNLAHRHWKPKVTGW